MNQLKGNFTLTTCLDILRHFYPPSGTLVVGAGNGTGPLLKWLSQSEASPVWLVEGDDEQYRSLLRLIPESLEWTVQNNVVVPDAESVFFYRTNNPAENGLNDPKYLKNIWPNLATEQVLSINAGITLDVLAEGIGSDFNWLILDCLSAKSLFRGAKNLFPLMDVILARVTMGEEVAEATDADHGSLDRFLASEGFECFRILNERHPKLGCSLYSRSPSRGRERELDRRVEALNEQIRRLNQRLQAADTDAVLASKREAEANERLEKSLSRFDRLQRKITSGTFENFEKFISDISIFFDGKSVSYVDVGACHAVTFLSVFKSKKLKVREAHLFEPNPKNYEKLRSAVLGLPLEALHTYPFAVSDGDRELQIIGAQSMTKVAQVPVMSASTLENSYSVHAASLDSMTSVFTDGRIDILKVDVEGHELEVLEGAKNLLREQKIDVVYIEVGFNPSGTQQVYFCEIDRLLQKHQYRCFRIYEQVHEWLQDSPLLRRCNFAYFSKRFADKNPYKIMNELYKLRRQTQHHSD